MLFWEGEEKHSSDKRVVESVKNGDEIHLFYREVHHTPFVYFGKISLTDYQLRENAPSEFVFRIEALSTKVDAFKEVREHAAEYIALDRTEQEQIVISRLGQGNFRRNVIRLLLMFKELISVRKADFASKFKAYCGNYLSKIQ
jgi:hypothetical protein